MSAGGNDVDRTPVFKVTYMTTGGTAHTFQTTMGDYRRVRVWGSAQPGGFEAVTPPELYAHMAWQHASNQAREVGEVALPFDDWCDGITVIEAEVVEVRPTTGVPSGT